MSGRTAAVVSFRLGGNDGVSVEAAKWVGALRTLGFDVRQFPFWERPTIREGVERAQDLREAIEGADVVVADNVLSLPLDPAITAQVAAALRGRATIVRHHDLPWQRPQWASTRRVPDDPAWVHVTINSRSAGELRAHQGIEATVLPNRFPLDGWDVAVPPHEGRVLVHPVRAIPRKDVPTALRLAERLRATYWLTGPAEDGFGAALDQLLARARCPVRRGQLATSAGAYASSDAVAFPSTVEGFGNPVVESALARRPLAVRRYPVLVDDLEPLGFRWFDPDDADGRLDRFLHEPDPALLDHNEALAREHFGIDRLPGELAAVLERVL